MRKLFITTLLFLFMTAAKAQSIQLTGYWENWQNAYNPNLNLRLSDIPTSYNTVIIAFADLHANGTVTFTLQAPPYYNQTDGVAQFKNDIQSLQQQGRKVLLSLGGQNGFYQVNNDAQNAQFIQSLEQLIDEYHFDGIDYDLENGLNTTNEDYLLKATKELSTHYNQKLIFTLAPETFDTYWQMFPNGKYDKLIQSGLINAVQVQFYNSGCMPGNQADSACFAEGTEDFIVSQADSTMQIWQQHGIKNVANLFSLGFPSALNAAGGGYTDPTIIKNALTCLQTGKQCATYIPTQTYPNLSQIMTWDISLDAINGYAFANNIK